MRQLGLFESNAGFTAEGATAWQERWEPLRGLAQRLPAALRFGTSSWTFPGWSGIVYPPGTSERELRERGLALYSRHPLLRAVGIDRSYYAAVDRATLERYSAQLPDDFACVVKAPAALTTFADARSGQRNPLFLDERWLERHVLGPHRDAFHSKLAVLVFEFPPQRYVHELSPERFGAELDRFLAALPKDFHYAVELRNRALLTSGYAQLLRRHRVAHVFNFWEAMPALEEQAKLPGLVGASELCVMRLLIPPGRRYAERRAQMQPFDRVIDPQPQMRRQVIDLALAQLAKGRAVLVIVNNKAEGSSPLTIEALARGVVERLDGPRGGGEVRRPQAPLEP